MNEIMKECSKCRETKPLGDFPKNNRSKDGVQSYCKECKNKESKITRDNNRIDRPRCKDGFKKCNKCSKEKPLDMFGIDKYTRDGFRNKCKECVNVPLRKPLKIKHSLTHKTCTHCKQEKELSAFAKKGNTTTSRCKSCTNKILKEERANKVKPPKPFVKDGCRVCSSCKQEKELSAFRKGDYSCRVCSRAKENARNNIPENRERKRERENARRARQENKMRRADRRKSNPMVRLTCNLRGIVGRALKPYLKDSTTAEIVGISFEEFYTHIESLLTIHQNMHMYGTEFHIDHFIPLSSAISKEHAIALSNYRNLRPLSADLNMKKSDNMPYEIIDGEIVPFFDFDLPYIMENFEYFESLRNFETIDEKISEFLLCTETSC